MDETLPGERWRSVQEDGRYLVSDLGRVYSSRVRRLLRPATTDRGYLKVRIAGRQVYLHRLVCVTFHGAPRRITDHTDHIDFDRTNNAASNLRWLQPVVNSVRWNGRTSDGRIVWAHPDTPAEDHFDYEPPTEPFDPVQVARELADAGW